VVAVAAAAGSASGSMTTSGSVAGGSVAAGSVLAAHRGEYAACAKSHDLMAAIGAGPFVLHTSGPAAGMAGKYAYSGSVS
jgi:hypothetical protein